MKCLYCNLTVTLLQEILQLLHYSPSIHKLLDIFVTQVMLTILSSARLRIYHPVLHRVLQDGGGRHVSTMSAIKRGVGRSGSGSRMNPRQTDTRSSNRNPRSDYGEPSLSSRTPYRKRPDDSYDNSKSFRPKNDRERDGRATAPYSNNRFTARPKYNDQQGDGRVKAPFSDSRVAARPRYNDEENSRSSSKPFRPNNRQEGRDQFKAPFSENRFAARPRYNDQGDSQQDIRQPRSFPPSPFSPARIRTSRSETEDNLQPRSFQKSSTFLPARIRSSQSESEFQSSPYRSVRDTSTSRNSFDRGQQLRIGVPGEENSERQSVGYSANGNRFDRANDNYEGKDAREEVSFKTRDSRESFKIPLTTAASEFIYGRSSVLAALKAASRRLYRLYLVGSSGDDKNSFEELYKCALNNDVKIVWLNRPDELAALDRVVKGRPHNVRAHSDLEITNLIFNQGYTAGGKSTTQITHICTGRSGKGSIVSGRIEASKSRGRSDKWQHIADTL